MEDESKGIFHLNHSQPANPRLISVHVSTCDLLVICKALRIIEQIMQSRVILGAMLVVGANGIKILKKKCNENKMHFA